MDGDEIRVLLVEDDAFYAEIFIETLNYTERADYTVTHAHCLKDALVHLEEGAFDVIVLDLNLPDAQGLAGVSAAMKRASSLPIVVLTGTEDHELALSAMKIGVQDYLLKTDIELQFVPRALQYAIERKNNETSLARLARQDLLTGLPNRRHFMERLGEQLVLARRLENSFALMMLDLDHFKNVNDGLGHLAGDQLLRMVGERLRNSVRKTDIVARLGGDEFAVLLTNLKDPLMSHRMADLLGETLRKPYMLDGHEVYSGASIGVTVFSAEESQDPEELLKQADMALYRVKDTQRGMSRHYDPVMQQAVEIARSVEKELRSAFDNQRMQLFYQPVVDARSGDLVAVEALLRCPRADGTYLSPKAFMPVAESTGLIVPLGERVLREIQQQQKAWRDAGIGQFTVSVNVSPVQFKRPHLARLRTLISELVGENNGALSDLQLEIAEDSVMQNREDSLAIFQAFHRLGVKLAVHGFGRGQSSLALLKRLPFTQLKIDRSFVRELPEAHDDSAIVRAIIHIASALGLEVVADGVENRQQLSWLLAEGCYRLQGSYIGGEMTAERFTDWYKARDVVPLASGLKG